MLLLWVAPFEFFDMCREGNWDVRFLNDVPYMDKVIWLMYTQTFRRGKDAIKEITVEWANVGPCKNGAQVTTCGRDAEAEEGEGEPSARGINHRGKHAVRHFAAPAGSWLVCAVRT